MKKWLSFILFLLFVSAGILVIFNSSSSPAEAGVSISAHISAICGNGIIETGEQCDGANLGGQTCVGLGYTGGTLSCKACTFNTSNCTSGGGGGGGGVITRGAIVILQGKAYPSAKITILKDGQVITIITTDSLANFKTELTTLTGGTYTFGLWAEDKAGRKSITFSFTMTVHEGMTTTIGGIFIPPTIELEKTNLAKGETLNILGQTAPESEITILVESSAITKKTSADEKGDWDYPFNTQGLDEGSHTTRAKAEGPGDFLSSYSKVLGFYIGKYERAEICSKADFNKDGKTNLVDFSIMLYWWKKYNPCVDQKQDGIVDLYDFSILMYWWTG